MGKNKVKNQAENNESKSMDEKESIPAIRHFNYREKRKRYSCNLHEYVGEIETVENNLRDEMELLSSKASEREILKEIDFSCKRSCVVSVTKTEVSVDKEITGNENDESRQVPAVRHLNYRRGVYQHEFNLHEYINEREEMIRYLISEKEHCKKIDKQLNKLVKDAEDLTRKTEMKTSDGCDKLESTLISHSEPTKPFIITSDVDGKPLSVDDLFHN